MVAGQLGGEGVRGKELEPVEAVARLQPEVAGLGAQSVKEESESARCRSIDSRSFDANRSSSTHSLYESKVCSRVAARSMSLMTSQPNSLSALQ